MQDTRARQEGGLSEGKGGGDRVYTLHASHEGGENNK